MTEGPLQVTVDVLLSMRSPSPEDRPVLVIRRGNVELELEFTAEAWEQLRQPFRRTQGLLAVHGTPQAAQDLLHHFGKA